MSVQQLICQKYGLEMPIRTVCECLKHWGFTPQKPVNWAKEQRTPAVAQWLLKEYPAIAARAKQEKTEIYWGDERIEVFYLPSYSPELNPDEYLNGELKGSVHSDEPEMSWKPRSESECVTFRIGRQKSESFSVTLEMPLLDLFN